MSQHNMEVILARSAFGTRLQRASGAARSIGNHQQQPGGQDIIGNGAEISSSTPRSVTTTIPILKSSPPPPYSTELHVISAETPSSEDDGIRSASRTPRVRPAQRVRFSEVEGRWTYDVDECTSPVCPDAVSHDRGCQASAVRGESTAQLDVRLYTDFPIVFLYTFVAVSALQSCYDIYCTPAGAAQRNALLS
ncbi:hypothetical protein MTO96_021115 [Rhipicephalus appendiculatus]